jgi:MFS family permease
MSSGFRRSLGLYIELLRIYNVKLLLSSFTLLVIQVGFLSWYTPILINEWFHYLAPVIYSLLFWDDALFTPISGPLADTWGRKKLIVIGTSFYPIGTLLLILGMVLKILGSDVVIATILVALGLVLALGVSSVTHPATSALLMESVDADKRATANSMFTMVHSIVLSTGSILFAYLLSVLGVLEIFIFIFALSTLATILRLYLRETFTETTGSSKLTEVFRVMKRNMVSGFKYSPVRALLTLSLVISVGHGIIFFATPLYLTQNLGFSEIAIGSIYALIPLLRIFLPQHQGLLVTENPTSHWR